MGKWIIKKLSEVVKINSGIALPKIFKTENVIEKEIPFYKVAQMNNDKFIMCDAELWFTPKLAIKEKIKIFQKGSVLIPKRGGAILTNKKRLLVEDASYDSNIMGLKADNNILTDSFLYKFMLSVDLSNFVDECIIPQINNKHIDRIKIPLPPIKQQQQIVSKLDALFARIDKSIALLEENIQHTKDLMSSVLDEEFNSINNDELIIKKLGTVLTLKRGYDLPKRLRKKGEFPLYGANGIIDFHNDYKVKGQGVCTGRSGSIGLIHFVEKDYWPLNTSLYVQDFKGNTPEYIYFLLRTYSKKLKQQAAYAAVPTLDRKNAHNNIFVNIHNINKQATIVRKLRIVENRTNSILNQQIEKLKHLQSLKSSLLDMAFKGELV